jgi:hypothetical protein
VRLLDAPLAGPLLWRLKTEGTVRKAARIFEDPQTTATLLLDFAAAHP